MCAAAVVSFRALPGLSCFVRVTLSPSVNVLDCTGHSSVPVKCYTIMNETLVHSRICMSQTVPKVGTYSWSMDMVVRSATVTMPGLRALCVATMQYANIMILCHELGSA